MFYGALVLSKKGPLAKVWLAAHWDKKLTKAHVFETDVESTVDNIISPQMKLALRTSGHLLLGVVRIYSRKQKYLLHDLGEACAKIKMAFRPGVVDLPASNGAENTDAITLPEIFHDFEIFENAMDTMEIKAQHTVNRSRVSEITMADDPTSTSGSGNLFGGEFDGYDLQGGEFERGMEDVEVPREAEGAGPGALHEVSEKDGSGSIVLGDVTKGGVSHADNRSLHVSADERPSDAANDFGGEGMFGEDGFGDFGGGILDFTPVPDLTIGEGSKARDGDEPMETDVPLEADPPQPIMEVDPPQQISKKQPAVTARGGQTEALEDTLLNRSEGLDDNTLVNRTDVEEEGFVLEPVETTGMEKRVKKKRRLVVDTDKEFTGQQIKSQFDDFKDLLQAKCFPPPTKKAMMWKEMAGCDQLYSNPTFPSLGLELRELVTCNYSIDIPGEPAPENLIELDKIADASREADIMPVENMPEVSAIDANTTDSMAAQDSSSKVEAALLENVGDQPDILGDEGQLFDFENGLGGGMGGLGGEAMGGEAMGGEPPEDRSATLDAVVDLDAQYAEEQQSNELSEDFELRRWTKRTQQVLAVLQSKLSAADEVNFSSLTFKCNRKQAASRFYTCLLLAKEGMITATQQEPYADIRLKKGPKYVE